jgi:hypothetical protein
MKHPRPISVSKKDTCSAGLFFALSLLAESGGWLQSSMKKQNGISDMPNIPTTTPYRMVSRQLTTCSVIEGGKTIRFDFVEQAGESMSIEMPFHQAESIVMTIPQLLSAALKMQTGNAQTRYVFSVGDWSLESAKDQNHRVLAMRTPDGFEVAFAIPFETSMEMGSALRCASEAVPEEEYPEKPAALH